MKKLHILNTNPKTLTRFKLLTLIRISDFLPNKTIIASHYNY